MVSLKYNEYFIYDFFTTRSIKKNFGGKLKKKTTYVNIVETLYIYIYTNIGKYC